MKGFYVHVHKKKDRELVTNCDRMTHESTALPKGQYFCYTFAMTAAVWVGELEVANCDIQFAAVRKDGSS
jgi:hypothetical protein